jgi:hypothetical protein
MNTHTIAFNVHEARRRLGDISHPHFYQLIRDGKLKVSKLGRRVVVTDKQISECLAACEVVRDCEAA